MKKEKHLKSYTAEELSAMRQRGKDLTDWKKVDATSNEEDSEDTELDWSKAVLVMPESKHHINLRVDADVLRFFKGMGKGYQTRMNAVLRSYMHASPHSLR